MFQLKNICFCMSRILDDFHWSHLKKILGFRWISSILGMLFLWFPLDSLGDLFHHVCMRRGAWLPGFLARPHTSPWFWRSDWTSRKAANVEFISICICAYIYIYACVCLCINHIYHPQQIFICTFIQFRHNLLSTSKTIR